MARSLQSRVVLQLLRAFGWAGFCLFALALSALLHADTRIGRKVLAAWIGDVVSPAMRGDLSIGRIERMSLDGLVFRRVELFDAQGRRVAHGGRLTLIPDRTALREGRIRFGSASLQDATVWLFDKGDGLPTFVECFDAPPGHASSGGKPLQIEVDGIEIERVTLIGDLLGLHGLLTKNVRAAGRLDIGSSVEVRIDRATGTLDEPFGFPAQVDALRGTISTRPERGVQLEAAGHRVPTPADGAANIDRSREHASASIRYAARSAAPGSPDELGLEVHATELHADTMQGLGFDWMPELRTPVSGRFALRGPLDDFGFDAALTTDAGPAALTGHAHAAGTSVTITTDGIVLDKVLAGAPAVKAQGLLRIDVQKDAPYPALHAQVEPLLYERFAIPGFDFDGALTDRGLRIDSLHAHSEGARLEGHGTVDHDGALDVQVKAHFADIGRDANMRRLVPDASGSLDANVAVTMSGVEGDVLHADGVISMGHMRYGGVRAKLLSLRGRVRGSADHPAARLQVSGTELVVGDYLLGDPRLLVTGGPHVFKAEGQFITAGKRTFDMQATLTVEGQSVVIAADPIEVVVGGGSWRGALAGLRVHEGGVDLERLLLANRSQRLEARGKVRFHGADELEAQLQDFDLAVVHALVDAFPLERGRADASVSLSGELSAPVLRLQGALREGAIAGVEQINAVYLIDYVAGALQADGEIDLGERGVVQLTGTGQIDPRDPDPVHALRYGAYDLDVSSQGLAIGLLPAIARRKVSGLLSGELHVRGTVHDPSLDGRVELHELSLPDWSPLDLDLEGRYARGQLNATLGLADRGGALATAGGQLALDLDALRAGTAPVVATLLRGPWQLSGQTTARRLDHLPAPLAAKLPFPVLFGTEFDLRKQNGALGGELRFDGTWAEQLQGAGCAQAAKPRVRGALVIEGSSSKLQLTVLAGPWQIGTFDATLDTPFERWIDAGSVQRPGNAQASGRIAIQAMQRVPYLCTYGSGSLDAELEIDRSGGAEPLLVAHVNSAWSPRNLQSEHKRADDMPSCEQDPLRLGAEVNVDRKTLSATGTMTGCHGAATELSANLPVEWETLFLLPLIDMQRDASADVSFDGAQLKPLLEAIPGVSDADARAQGSVQLRGPLAHPHITGQVAVSDGKLYLVSTGQLWTDVEAGLDFRDSWIKLTHFSARSGRGLIEAEGGIGLAGIVPDRAQLAVHADRVPIKQEGVDLGWLSGAAAVDASIEAERTRAEIKIHDLLVRLPDTTNRTLQALEPHPDVALTTVTPAPPPGAYLVEFMIDGQRNITVKRNDFEATIGTELAVRYHSPDLAVGGYIQFNRGEFEVFGKRFTINAGSLRFDGTNDINPDVFLLATQRDASSGNSPVTVSVTGTLAKPEITFASDACPGDTGAITYLIAGQCVSDDPDLAQGSQDAEDAFASGMASGVLTLGAQHELSGLMPRIAVQGNRSGERTVSAGFYSSSIVPKFMRSLVQRVYLQGGLTSGGNGTQTTTTEEATPSTSVDFLMELYFPHDLVGAGHFGQSSWGLDVTWEP